jgi:hypothetical protein
VGGPDFFAASVFSCDVGTAGGPQDVDSEHVTGLHEGLPAGSSPRACPISPATAFSVFRLFPTLVEAVLWHRLRLCVVLNLWGGLHETTEIYDPAWGLGTPPVEARQTGFRLPTWRAWLVERSSRATPGLAPGRPDRAPAELPGSHGARSVKKCPSGKWHLGISILPRADRFFRSSRITTGV